MTILAIFLQAFFLAIFFVGFFSGLIWLLERKERRYQKINFKVGDKVTFALHDSIKDAEILEINDDEFVIKTTIHRGNFYPKKEWK